MFRYVKFRIELRRLSRIQKRLDAKYKVVYEDSAKQGNDDGELSAVGQEAQEVEMWIQYRQTEYLKSICQAYIIPFPAQEDDKLYFNFNFDDEEGDRFILTTAGIHLVRGMIRDERKARREVVGFWLAMTTGILGSLIGLVSVLKKW